MTDLKRCPFCGGEAKISHMGPYVSKTSKVEFEACGACTKYFFISTEYAADTMAAEAWNRRQTMTRDDFMAKARGTARQILEGKENGIMNLVQQAWAEGKRNAEAETLKDAIEQALALHYGIPQNDEDCVLLYKGQKIKCKMGMIEYSDNAAPNGPHRYRVMAVRKFEVYEEI